MKLVLTKEEVDEIILRWAFDNYAVMLDANSQNCISLKWNESSGLDLESLERKDE